MIRLVGTITYRDGRAEPCEVTQGEYAAWEIYALRNGMPATPDRAPPFTMTRYLAYAAVQRASDKPAPADWEPFGEWDADVADVTLDADPADTETARAIDPFRSERSAT